MSNNVMKSANVTHKRNNRTLVSIHFLKVIIYEYYLNSVVIEVGVVKWCWCRIWHTEDLSESFETLLCNILDIGDVQKVLQIKLDMNVLFRDTELCYHDSWLCHLGFLSWGLEDLVISLQRLLSCLFCISSSWEWTTAPRSWHSFPCVPSDHYNWFRMRNWSPEKFPQLQHRSSLHWISVAKKAHTSSRLPEDACQTTLWLTLPSGYKHISQILTRHPSGYE